MDKNREIERRRVLRYFIYHIRNKTYQILEKHEHRYFILTHNYLFNICAYKDAIRMDSYVIYRDGGSIRYLPSRYKDKKQYIHYSRLLLMHISYYHHVNRDYLNQQNYFDLSFDELVNTLFKNYE